MQTYFPPSKATISGRSHCFWHLTERKVHHQSFKPHCIGRFRMSKVLIHQSVLSPNCQVDVQTGVIWHSNSLFGGRKFVQHDYHAKTDLVQLLTQISLICINLQQSTWSNVLGQSQSFPLLNSHPFTSMSLNQIHFHPLKPQWLLKMIHCSRKCYKLLFLDVQCLQLMKYSPI